MPIKVYTLSDLHIDYQGNLQHLLSLKGEQYSDATIIVSGDASDNLEKLGILLSHFKKVFAEVFFVPGNHELWVRDRNHVDSVQKFNAILALCKQLNVRTQPHKLIENEQAVWIVPLFSWYTKPEQAKDSLFVSKPGDDQTELIWSDNRFCNWDSLPAGQMPVDYFLGLNKENVKKAYDAPVISFSHFLPSTSLVFHISHNPDKPINGVDPMPEFNFTRVAGTTRLLDQIKKIGSTLHIHGHQHRNRHRTVDGIMHISHCLGYPRERQSTHWHGDNLPKLIWDSGVIEPTQPF
jgi:Icc-related predicted phosphoesterase